MNIWMRVARTLKVKVISNKEQLGLFSLKEGVKRKESCLRTGKGLDV